ncbi:ABC transporter permease subunit [Mycoplasma sp. ES3157-GEN-MYC]|uniref:ABC transporter permease subunit n=1 Tax=Mycoplasma miroungigenitalium TaxID=754515 RepID=A0A6M4J8Z3_9MOLU|nr:ABC transporter permease subunit [Mycoplasma miroungigenitalium]MBU4690291.1 ABC transporter permease subunit [Mycoplasma miroungigenitalium]QJR43390.1 ABC transporter permease subunit [Mycoplasma miroungigenitalium]
MRTNRISTKNSVAKISKFYKYQYISAHNDKTTGWKINPIFKRIAIFLIVAGICTLIAFQAKNINFLNSDLILKKLRKLFIFSNKSTVNGSATGIYTDLWKDSFNSLWITIKLALAGTFVGFVFAIITAILSFKAVTNKFVAYIFKLTILFLRAIPEIVFILLITNTFRNEICLMIVYLWFTWLWLHKYYIEILQNVDLNPYYLSINQGNTKFKAFIKEIWPRINNRIFALFIFSFESNIRWAAILGALSLPGIGVLINYASEKTIRFTQLGVPLLVLMGFIIFLEIINILLKNYLFETKSKPYFQKYKFKTLEYQRLAKTINFRKLIMASIFLICTVITIWTVTSTPIWFFNLTETKLFFNAFFHPNFSGFKLNSWDHNFNPFLMIWESISFTIMALAICIFFTFISVRLQSIRLNKIWLAVFWRGFNALIRLIPTVVYFYVFLPILTASPFFLIIIILGLHEMSSKSKQLVEAVDNLDEEIITNMRMQGYSNNQIYLKFIIPSLKREIISLTIFYFELIFRNSITYAIFAQNELSIGNNIYKNLDGKTNFNPQLAMGYIWIATISILTINICGHMILNWNKIQSNLFKRTKKLSN